MLDSCAMRRALLRTFGVIAVGLVAFDAAQDAVNPCGPADSAFVCHACVCGPHAFSNENPIAAPSPAPQAYSSHEISFHTPAFPKSIFHPPRPIN